MATFTVWQGNAFIATANLTFKRDPRFLGGRLEPTDELRALGPMSQVSVMREGRLVIFQKAMDRPVTRSTSGGDLDRSESWAPLYTSDKMPEVSVESALYLRDADSNILRPSIIGLFDPNPLPEEFARIASPEELQHLRSWMLSCQIASWES